MHALKSRRLSTWLNRLSVLSLLVLVASGGHALGAPKVLQPGFLSRQTSGGTRAAARFAVIGDGGTRERPQQQVAAALARQHAAAPFSSLLLLGDNVYPNGEVEHFDASIEQAYAPLLRDGVRLYGILGNHDIRTDRGRAQLRYLGNGEHRWFQERLPGTEVELFALDTTVMVDAASRYYGASSSWARAAAKTELAWLDDALAGSDAKLKIVLGHHPLYSADHAGRKDERELMRSQLEPIMVRHGVVAYLAGHDHTYARSQPISGITHFVSGGGGQAPEAPKTADYPRAAASVKNHFLVFEAKGEALHFEMRDTDGVLIDAGSLRGPANAKGREHAVPSPL